LRRAGIGRRQRVLEVGSGHGVVTGELRRRAQGEVFCLDRDLAALRGAEGSEAPRVAGDCRWLPFCTASFDLLFFQNTLLWVPELELATQEAARVLRPGGALVAIEPDYGGMMEHPRLGLQELWLTGLSAAGADPEVGRKLPSLCEAEGLRTWVELSHLPRAAGPEAIRLLDDLPLSEAQRDQVRGLAEALRGQGQGWSPFVHVPYFLIVASKP